MSPELFTIHKIGFRDIVKKDYNLILSKKEKEKYEIKQQYNHLFRIINNITNNKTKHINEIIFVDCRGGIHGKNKEKTEKLLKDGFTLNNIKYLYYGASASMSRNSIVGFLSESIYNEVNKYAMMDLEINNTVISKFEAYKHLLMSSCFCIEGEIPRMIVVDDYDMTVDNVYIKYVYDVESTYKDKKTGEIKSWNQKALNTGYKSIVNTINDGSGLMNIKYAKYISEKLNIPYTGCAFMLRLPYIKGVSVSFDIENFYKEKGIIYIKDIWGESHKVEDIDIILTKSQYKGFKFFKKDGKYSDWENYIKLLKKYNYCLGIAKWNFSQDKEPKKVKANYQVLQTLDIDSDAMLELYDYTKKWVENIINGDIISIYNYLGLNKEKIKPSNNYMRAVLLNPTMVYDVAVRNYVINLLNKTVEEMCLGKVFVDGCFKILCPDVIFMAEYIGGLTPKGTLKTGEIYSKGCSGEYILNRNPHICKSEHVVRNAVNNENIDKWLSHLEGVCMVNCYDITAKSLNGADYDGDLALVHNTPTFFKGIHKDLPLVIDIEDKITAIEKPYTKENIIETIMSSMDSRIGEISNHATSYHNKKAKTSKTQQKYEDYTCLLSVINGKEIDKAKTGVRWNVPRYISKYSRPFPYFLKYKYDKLKQFNHSKSNLNVACWDVEKWWTELKRKKVNIDTSHCMMDDDIPFDEHKYYEVEKIFKEFKREYSDMKLQESIANNYELYKDFWEGVNKNEIKLTKLDWGSLYNKYKKKLENIVPNQSELANLVIEIVYNKYKGTYYKFAWNVAEEGILTNLRKNRIEPLMIPVETNDPNDTEYLGKYYKLQEYKGVF